MNPKPVRGQPSPRVYISAQVMVHELRFFALLMPSWRTKKSDMFVATVFFFFESIAAKQLVFS
jgi:hypothetical protein